jgi:hypothetical protein
VEPEHRKVNEWNSFFFYERVKLRKIDRENWKGPFRLSVLYLNSAQTRGDTWISAMGLGAVRI